MLAQRNAALDLELEGLRKVDEEERQADACLDTEYANLCASLRDGKQVLSSMTGDDVSLAPHLSTTCLWDLHATL